MILPRMHQVRDGIRLHRERSPGRRIPRFQKADGRMGQQEYEFQIH